MSKPETQLPNEYTIDDIAEVFSIGVIAEIDEYQRLQAEHARHLLQNPIPQHIHRTFHDKAHLIIDNRARYEDTIEAVIRDDPTIQELKKALRKGYRREDVAPAQRARRSVIAYLAVKSTVV